MGLKKRIIILMGPPGCGKGTHAIELQKKLKIPHISTGNLFRKNIEQNTLLGKQSKIFLEKGILVPNEIVEKMLFKRISNKDCEKGFILDGFPRTLPQAKEFDKFFKTDSNAKIVVINFSVLKKVLIERITGRMICTKCKSPYHIKFSPPKKKGICDYCNNKLYQREDDTKEVLEKRLLEYKKKTKVLIDFYKKKDNCFFEVDGNANKKDVFENILKVIQKCF